MTKKTKTKIKSLEDLRQLLAEDLLDPEYPMELVEQELREAGLDPEKIAKDGQEFVDKLLKKHFCPDCNEAVRSYLTVEGSTRCANCRIPLRDKDGRPTF